jgi:hypothetical protein
MTDVTAEDIMNGAHALTTAGEVLEIFGTLPETLGVWVEPVGGVLQVITMVVNVVKALETEERGAGYRGTAYGSLRRSRNGYTVCNLLWQPERRGPGQIGPRCFRQGRQRFSQHHERHRIP